MHSRLGPFDRRAQRSRCQSCIKKHLKCEGGFPCKYCLRNCQKCALPKAASPFISLETSADYTFKAGSKICHIEFDGTVPRSFSDVIGRRITHFYSSFLRSNDFGGSDFEETHDVQSLLAESPGLFNAAIAVSALDIERCSLSGQKSENKAIALCHYKSAVESVRTELTERTLRTNESILWSTFFLGLFELMYDASGEGWIKHILHGTSQLLQFRGPAQHLRGKGRRFFLTVRIFEISRALIYSRETFLARTEWQMLMENMWAGAAAKDWHPKEDLFDLMISCSSLSIRAMMVIQKIPEASEKVDEELLIEFAEEGRNLASSLANWKIIANEWSSNACKGAKDVQMRLAFIYYHAILIYLSGTFDYHIHWTDRRIPTPVLSTSDVQDHVVAILSSVGSALKETNLIGLLFLFPLRVAGARARQPEQRIQILALLGHISQRGFPVANAFEMDLKELWAWK